MNVLVLRPDHIGDMLLTTPFLSAMKKGFPGWNISVLCGSWSLPILENNPNYSDVIVCNYPWLARGAEAPWEKFLSTIVKMRKEKFDIVINLRKAAKEAGVARAINGRQVWGFDMPKSAWAHTNTIPYHSDIHIADLYVEFANVLGAQTECCGLELYLTEEEVKDFNLSRILPPKYVILAPATPDINRLWVSDRWIHVADWIISELNLPAIFVGTEFDRPAIQKIMNSMRNSAHNTAGDLTLRQAALYIKNAEFLVSVNSAPVHIASALNTPVVSLYGPNNPKHWGPYPNGRANQAVSKVKEFKLGRGSHNKSGGMELITVDDVKSAIRTLCESEHIIF